MIRVNLLPREEKAKRKAAASPIDFKVGDMVMPAIIMGAIVPASAAASPVRARPRTSPTSGKKLTERPRSVSRSGPRQTGSRVRNAKAATTALMSSFHRRARDEA